MSRSSKGDEDSCGYDNAACSEVPSRETCHQEHHDEKEVLNEDDKNNNKTKKKTRQNRMRFLFGYGLFLMMIMIIHQILLIHRHVHLSRLLEESMTEALIDGTPGYIFGVVIILIGIVACLLQNTCNYYCLKKDYALSGIIVLLGINTLLFTVQTVVIMSKNVIRLLNNDTITEIVAARDLNPELVFPLFAVRQKSDEKINVSTEFKYIFTICETALVILILKIPIWFISRKILEEENYFKISMAVELEHDGKIESIKGYYGIGRKASNLTTFRRACTTARDIEKLKKETELTKSTNKEESKARYRHDVRIISELALYGVGEGLDAFSFLGDFIKDRSVWIEESRIAEVVLAFMCINILLLNVFDCLSMYEPTKCNAPGKFGVILLNDIPLLVCRSIILARHPEDLKDSLVFILFIVKEVIVVLIGIMEFSVEFA